MTHSLTSWDTSLGTYRMTEKLVSIRFGDDQYRSHTNNTIVQCLASGDFLQTHEFPKFPAVYMYIYDKEFIHLCLGFALCVYSQHYIYCSQNLKVSRHDFKSTAWVYIYVAAFDLMQVPAWKYATYRIMALFWHLHMYIYMCIFPGLSTCECMHIHVYTV